MDKLIVMGLGNPGKKYENTRHNAGKMFVQWMNKGRRRRPEALPGGIKEDLPASRLTAPAGWQAGGRRDIKAVETECFMNESGEWVKEWLAYREEGRRKKEEGMYNSSFLLPSTFYLLPLIVAHDDLDIPLGKFKIQFGKGPRQHRGLESIYQALGTKNFWHVRVGIDKREEGRGKKEEGETYVLGNFSREERKLLEEEVFPAIYINLHQLLKSSPISTNVHQ